MLYKLQTFYVIETNSLATCHVLNRYNSNSRSYKSMPLHSNLNSICGNTLRLGISVSFRPPSVALVELLDNYRKSKYYYLPTTDNLTQWTHPFIYYGIQGKYRKNVHDELPSIISLFSQFDVELIPHYTDPSGPNRNFQVGFKCRHEALGQMRFAFSRWSGEGFCHDNVLRSSTSHQLGSYLFFPIQVMKTEDEIQVQYAIRELTSLLRNFGNIFTADTLLLQEYWSNTNGTPIYSSTLAAYPLDSSKHQILEGLSKLRMLALKEEVIDSHKPRSINTFTSEKTVTPAIVRKIMGIPKFGYEKKKLQQRTIPALENQITIFRNKRFLPKVPTNLKNYNPERKLINNSKNSSGKISFKDSRPNANSGHCLFTESTSSFVPRCTRQEARRLETERLNRPLIRYEKSDLVIRYKYYTYDSPLEKYKCYIHNIFV